jgi:xanthosine utilization system XapX-like protein
MLLPMVVFALMQYFFGITAGVVSIAILGLIGFLLREKIFDIIVRHYKVEKYSTLDAFKNKD